MTQFREVYEGLANYRAPLNTPTAVVAPVNNPRQALKRPIDNVPGMPNPVPTSSKTIKKTNVQIPIARRVFQEPDGVGNLLNSVQEGDIVFSMRGRNKTMPHHAMGTGLNAPVTVRTIESINMELALEEPRLFPYNFALKEENIARFPFDLDGIVNNLDGEDPYHEFREPPIANVAVRGPCRLDNREKTQVDSRQPSILSAVYVALEASTVFKDSEKGPVFQGFKHQLKRFTSDMLLRYEYVAPPQFDAEKKQLTFATTIWRVGYITDTNQSPGMLTCQVSTAEYKTMFDTFATDYQPVNPETKNPAYVLRWETDAENKIVPKRFGSDICLPSVAQDLEQYKDLEFLQGVDIKATRCVLPGNHLAHLWGLAPLPKTDTKETSDGNWFTAIKKAITAGVRTIFPNATDTQVKIIAMVTAAILETAVDAALVATSGHAMHHPHVFASIVRSILTWA